MEREELAAWLRLQLTPGVGSVGARRLLAAFGLPESIFAQSGSALRHVVAPAQAWALQHEPEGLAERLETTWRWLQGETQGTERPGVERAVVALGDAGYPRALLDIDDPPLLLYLLGQVSPTASPFPATARSHGAPTTLSAVAARGLAIVGSRNPTPQGEADARRFARSFAEAGLTVVSGLALGIDGAAHQGALEGVAAHAATERRLATVAVVGTGLDRVYPKQHLALARRIAEHGLLLSEYPLGTPPAAENFPRRNRLIAGLSRGTLVVEAALKSGSLITARLAAEQGKEVFAIPGSIHSAQSHGCHALIRQGAKLVESARDVLEELGVPVHAHPEDSNSIADDDRLALGYGPKDPKNAVLEALGHGPVGLDALLARTGLDAANLQAQLLELELDGHVARLSGGLFQRQARA